MEPLKSTGGAWVLPMQRLEVLMEQIVNEVDAMRPETMAVIVGRMPQEQREAIRKIHAAIEFNEVWGDSE